MSEAPVWTAGKSPHGGVGRYHLQQDCPMLAHRRKLVQERERPQAERLGYWLCPYCAPLPACCQAGQHAALALPPLPVAERPDWEDPVG